MLKFSVGDRVVINEAAINVVKKALPDILGQGEWVVIEIGSDTSIPYNVQGPTGNHVWCPEKWLAPLTDTKINVTSEDLMGLLE